MVQTVPLIQITVIRIRSGSTRTPLGEVGMEKERMETVMVIGKCLSSEVVVIIIDYTIYYLCVVMFNVTYNILFTDIPVPVVTILHVRTANPHACTRKP